jgi:hypothetical protein
VLYALATPVAFVGLLVGFVLAVTVHGWAQAVAAARLGDKGPRLAGRGRFDPRRHLDPFGAVAAALAGVGWGRAVELERRRFGSRGRWVAAVLAGPLAVFVLGALALVGYVVSSGAGEVLRAVSAGDVLHGFSGLPARDTLLLSTGMALVTAAVLELVPLPPLDGGMLLFGLGPKGSGWRKAEYQLAEQNWGIGILLVLLVLPLAGRLPLLLLLLGLVVDPLVGVVGALS